MSFHIHFENSDKPVVIENNETILDAAIRAGVEVNYGCNNGTCGTCIAKCIDGCIQPVRNSDYVFDREFRDGKHFLMCSSTACSDLQVNAFLSEEGTYPTQKLNTRIKSIERDENGITQLLVRVPRSQRLRFHAGQYALLRHIEWGQGTYPIASCPCDAQQIEFYLYDFGTPFVSALLENVKKKEALEVTAPFGSFTFSEDMQRPIILISYGGGFTLIKSLTEHILSQESQLSVTLYTAGDIHDHFVKLCRIWEDSLDQMVHHCLSKDGTTLVASLSEQIDESIATASDFYLSAPPAINDALVKMLKAKNVASQSIRRQDVNDDGSIEH